MRTGGSTVDRDAAIHRIREVGIVPVVRTDTEDAALRIAEALVAAELTIVEITMTVPGALNVMASLARRFGGDLLLGAGTVTSANLAQSAVAAGCAFLVTPGYLPSVVGAAKAERVAVIAGALTPTEILAAHEDGADLVKVFPVSAVGGPAYIRALRGPLPLVPLVATGGVSLDRVAEYVEAGVAAIGVGGELVAKSAVKAGNYGAVEQAARAFMEAVRRARAGSETADGGMR